MAGSKVVYFAQLTDIHVGDNNLNGERAQRNLTLALEELAGLEPKPEGVLVTADHTKPHAN